MPSNGLPILVIAIAGYPLGLLAATGQDIPLTDRGDIQGLSVPAPDYTYEEEVFFSFGADEDADAEMSDQGTGLTSTALDPENIPPRAAFSEPVEALFGDWNSDGYADFAVFDHDATDYVASVAIFEGKPDGSAEKVADLPRAFRAKGETFGLQARSDTAFGVIVGALMGHDHFWSRNVVIAYREGDYVIAGIEDSNSFARGDGQWIQNRCDVNFRTGRAERVFWFFDSEPFLDTWNQKPQDLSLNDISSLDAQMADICSSHWPDLD